MKFKIKLYIVNNIKIYYIIIFKKQTNKKKKKKKKKKKIYIYIYIYNILKG